MGDDSWARLEAARDAMVRGDVATAVPALVALADGDDLPEAHHLLGGAYFMDDHLDDMGRELERAFRGYRDRGDLRAAARVGAALAQLHHDSLGNVAAGRGWLERSRRLLEQCGHCVEWGYVELAFIACGRDDVDALEASADRAFAIAEEFGDHDLEVRALADGGLALVTAGRVAEGLRRLDEAMTAITAGEVQDPMAAGLSFCSMLASCERIGDVARAEEWTRLARAAMFDPLGGRPVILHTHCVLAYGAVLRDAGRWTEAETLLLEGLGPKGSRSLIHRSDLAAQLAELRIDQGRLDEAADVLAPYEDTLVACVPLARLHVARGRADLAVAVCRRGLRRLRGDTVRAAPILAVLVDAELRLGDVAAGAAATDQLEAVAQRAESVVAPALAALARGHVHLAGSDAEAAVASFDNAAELLAGGGRPLLAAEAHLSLAEALAASGDTPGAVAEARAAQAQFERLAARTGVDRCNFVLRALGAPGRPRGREAATLVSGLTAREHDVLRLVQQGRTNAEIAAELYISPKTAEHHVGRLLAKLGVRTRTEAAAIAASLEATPID
jgi:DNA-binding CsgD family transcriptional regulator